jgi:hypothetical protein
LGLQIPEEGREVRRAANISLGSRRESAVEPLRARIIVRRRAELKETVAMRSILLWLIGVPIPIILLLAFCTHHF